MSEVDVKKLNEEELNEVAGGRKSDLAVAYDVMEGKYGNGEERIRRLLIAGYNPTTIQEIVNTLVKNNGRDPYMDPPGSAGAPRRRRDPYMD